MSKRAALMIDGGHLRVLVRKARKTYDPDYIEKVALACRAEDKEFLRIFYLIVRRSAAR
jgi:hypothetical protein